MNNHHYKQEELMDHIIDYDHMCRVCQGKQRVFRWEYSPTTGKEVLVGEDCNACVGGYRAIFIGKKR
jgi:hypothetical protein